MVKEGEDRITANLLALQFYQLSLPSPKALAGTFNAAAVSLGSVKYVN